MRNHRLAILAAAAAIATASAFAAAAPAHAETTFFELQNAESSFCLQPADGSSGLGVPIVQDTCNGSLAQQWTEASSSSGFHLVNKSTGLCMDARGAAASDTLIEQWTCDWISNENWKFLPGPQLASGVSGTYTYCASVVIEFLGYFGPVLLPCGNGIGEIWN